MTAADYVTSTVDSAAAYERAYGDGYDDRERPDPIEAQPWTPRSTGYRASRDPWADPPRGAA
jgi:hypothetical protein